MRSLHRLVTCLLVLCVVALGLSRLAEAQKKDELTKLREEFIRSFPRLPINTTPEDAQLLRILVEASNAKRGVEVGTATGYGAIHMGWGFERNGGQLITIDIDPKMVQQAQANLKKVKLDKTVTVVQGDALKVLPTLEGQFDFVFIDAVKRDYLKYFRAIEPKLVPGAVIVADNVIRFRNQMLDFLETIEKDPRYLMVTVRASELKHDGMAIIYKLR